MSELADRIWRLAQGRSPSELQAVRAELLECMTDAQLDGGDSGFLMERLSAIARITDDQATRRGFVRSCCRMAAGGILKDGRGSSIIIEITKNCNKDCDHCYSRTPDDRSMDDAVLERLVQLARTSYKHVFYTGGEPLLDERTFRTVSAVPDVMFFMFTNGELVDDEMARRFAALDNLIPIVSIDGSTRELHESFRGAGSFDRVTRAIECLRSVGAPWGYISVVTNHNARDVLGTEFIKRQRNRGAILGRYLEFHPVGPEAKIDWILTGETYCLMERRKREIVRDAEIYTQELAQDKCTGLLFFDVNGNIKLCPFFHYARYNIADGEARELIEASVRDWCAGEYDGECPVYSDTRSLKKHLESRGWYHTVPYLEQRLEDPEVSRVMAARYRDFLSLKQSSGA